MGRKRVSLVAPSRDPTPTISPVLDEDGRERLEVAFRDIGGPLWKAVYVYGEGSADLADECVAEAFAQAARGQSQIRSIGPWLYRVAFRLARKELLRRRELPVLEPPAELGVHSTDEAGIRDLLMVARQLSPNQRACFVLRDLYGYGSSEAAGILGISEVAVRVHLYWAHRRLRILLKEE